jgi:putative peptidoglycan lipid II flippase
MFLMVPGIIAGGVIQINMLVDTILASLLPTGSPSWLYVSDRLMQLPLGIFAIAIATVILPRLSNLFASESKEQFSSTLDWSMRLIFLIGIPAVIGLIMLAEPIILTLFERGGFREMDTSMASSSLIALAFGLLAFMLIKILTPSFFARQQPKKPMIVALISMVLNVFLAWLLAFQLGYAHVGLALASSISAFFTVFTLLFLLYKDKVYKPSKGWVFFFFRMLMASSILILLINYFGHTAKDPNIQLSLKNILVFILNSDPISLIHTGGLFLDYLRELSGFSRFLYIIKIVLIGMAGYFLSLWILGLRVKDFSSKDVFD